MRGVRVLLPFLLLVARVASAACPDFAAAANYAAGIAPQAIASGDFNRDGRLDLAVTNNNVEAEPSSVSIFLNSGGGAFAAAVNYTTGKNPNGIAVGDFNRDGKLDLATANTNSFNVSILMGNGDGTFAEKVDVGAVTGNPTSIVAADFENDGDLDLAFTTSGSNGIRVLINGGSGTFTLSATTYLVQTSANPVNIAAGDFNRDGYIDLITANYNVNSVSWIFGNGDGTFGAPTNLGAGANPGSVVTGDFNADGKPDFAVSNAGNHQVRVALGNGTGSNTFVSTNFYTATSPGWIALGDFDGDGRVDLATSGLGFNVVSILLGNGSGGFTFSRDLSTGSLPQGIAVGDWNGDGKADVATANYSSNNTSLFLNTSTCYLNCGTFSAVADPAVTSNPLSVVTADFNRDGKLDLLTANFTSNNVSYLAGVGNGTFAAEAHPVSDAGTGQDAVAVGDFDGTGTLDFATANSTSNDVSIFGGSGTGVFGSITTLPAGTSPSALVIADFNRDGRPDVAVANAGSNNVSMIIAFGAYSFLPKVDYSVGSNPQGVVAADFNRDGKLDLATANSGSGKVSILLGDGAGAFGSATDFDAAAGASALASGDFNADGKLDVAVATTAAVSVLLGNGDATFAPRVNYTLSSSGNGVAVGDVNGDGKLDLAVACNSGSVDILLGIGNGTFAAAVPKSVSSFPGAVVLGDFNRDGKLDFATANKSGHSVSVRLNNCPSPPTISKSFGAPSVLLNGTTSLSFTIANPNASFSLSGIGFTDTLPSGLVVASPNGLTGSCGGGTITAVADSNSVSLSGATLAGSANCTFSVTVKGTTLGTKNNTTGNVTSTQGGAGLTASATLTVYAMAPTISKSFGASSILVNSTTSLSFTINNPNSSTTLTTIAFTDSLPSGLVVATPNALSGSCGGGTITAAAGSGSVALSGATLAASAGCTFSVNVTGTTTGVKNNTTGAITSAESATGGTASASLNVVEPSDLTITKQHFEDFFVQGTVNQYVITVSNVGGGDTSGAVTVADTLPSGLLPYSITGAQGWACTLAQTVTCTRSDALAGGEFYPQIYLNVRIRSNATSLTNTATVSGGGDTNTANNSASDPTTVNANVGMVEPTMLIAMPASASQINVVWDAVTGAASYQIYRSSNNSGYGLLTATPVNGYSDTTVTPGTTYLYKVIAVDSGNAMSGFSNVDLATAMTFTDDPLVAGSTVIKAAHINELRTAVNAVRAAAGLSAATFTDSITAGVFIRAAHITELRTRLDEARAAILGIPPLSYTDSALTSFTTRVKAAHIQELRDGVK
jgi:uncharacterized repeat protein (TIGR01451 family)